MRRKVALLTGSPTGLGKRIAIELGEKGYDLVINYRSSGAEADTLAQMIRDRYGVATLTVQGDISHYADVERMVAETLQTFDSIDILIHTAGPFLFEYKQLFDHSVDEWHNMVDGNLSSMFYLCKQILPLMRQNRWGRIITFGFSMAETAPGWAERAAYAAAKTGLVSLTKTLALEEAPHGITVNMICPGDIVPPWKESSIAEVRKEPNNGTPVGRMGSGEDVSRVISFLVEEDSDFLTGSIIPVTGGRSSFQ